MIVLTNKIFIFFFSILILIAAVAYAYLQQAYVLIVPLLLLAVMFLLQYPEYLFYILILSIPWSVEYNFSPSLGTDLPDEPLMLLSSVAVLILIGYHRKKIGTKDFHFLLILLFFEVFWTLITVITSTNGIVSVKYILAKGWYLLAFIGLPLFLFRNKKVLKKSAILLSSSMFVLTLITLIRHGQWNWSFEKVNESLIPFFRNHVNYSSLLVFMVPLQIAIFQLVGKKLRFILAIALLLTIIALYFSYSRGAWLALITGLLGYWLLRRKKLVWGFLFFILIVFTGSIWLSKNNHFLKFSNNYSTTIFYSDFREHLIATYKLKDLSNAERIYRWVAGARMINDSWKTGFGPSAFYPLYKEYTLPAFKTYVSNNPEHSTVHNYFLLLLIEQGIIGLILFISLVASVFWYAQKIYFRTNNRFWKVTAAAVAAIMVMQCTINFLSDMIETDKVGSVFYLCVSVIIIADVKTRKRFETMQC